ncbi:MAG: PQQ-dependent sugar dehydrogenase [Gemmatimonadales bacterium]|nr:MAG: PQQ-dependent sugar dehydrogenase [Gemmatimonadales bacterium]
MNDRSILGTALLAFLGLGGLAGCSDASDARAAANPAGTESAPSIEVIDDEISTEYEDLRLVRLARMENPWGIGFLPNGDLLVTEIEGSIHRISGGVATRISGAPEPHVQNQGGLLDVVVHPDYEENGWIYLTWSKGDSDGTVPALSRARLEGDALVGMETLFESNTRTSPGRHYGSRILFLDDGTLLMTIGDRGAEPPRAQDTMDHSGSVVRLNHDGSVPADNPFVGNAAYAPEIWSYGHRNIQGIIRDPTTGEIWATEHGPRGGDELNRLEPGANYGWPRATLGRDYRTQEPFGDAETRDHASIGMTGPVFEFLPTLAPSGLAQVRGDAFPAWDGDLLAGGLRAERILRVVIDDGEVIHLEELLHGDVGRIRDVRQGPDGAIYLATEGEERGGIYRLEPAG